MFNGELKKQLDALLKECLENGNESTFKNVIAKAFTLGSNYKEKQIKAGIDIVFQELKK